MPSDMERAPAGAGAGATTAEVVAGERTPGDVSDGNGRPGWWARTRAKLAGRHELIKDYAQVFALVLAASWAIWVFFYENIYKPRQESPNVIVSTSLEESGRDKGLIAVKTTATAKNVGKRSASIISAWFNVEGFHLTRKDGPAADGYRGNVLNQLRRQTPEGGEIDMHASRYSDYDADNTLNRKYIFSTNFLLNHSALSPDEDESKVITFHVPENEFDLVRVILHVVYAKDGRFIRRDWSADADGQLKPVTYIRACDKCPEEEYKATNEVHLGLRQKYGMTHVQSVVDLPLWGKAASPPNRQSDSAMPLGPVVTEGKEGSDR